MSTPIDLPWEVVERIIEHASDDLGLLRSFSLSCRQLRPRSFSLIVAQYVFLDSRDKVFAFYDFLQRKPKLRSFIQSLIVSPAHFSPFPLVHVLPHLSTLHLISRGPRSHRSRVKKPNLDLHSTILSCYRLFGKCIQSISLDRLSFRTSCDLVRLVLAFPNMTQLICHDIVITSTLKKTPATEVMGFKLSKQLRLETLHVSINPLRAMRALVILLIDDSSLRYIAM